MVQSLCPTNIRQGMPASLQNVHKLLNYRKLYRGYKLSDCIPNPQQYCFVWPLHCFKICELAPDIKRLDDVTQKPSLPMSLRSHLATIRSEQPLLLSAEPVFTGSPQYTPTGRQKCSVSPSTFLSPQMPAKFPTPRADINPPSKLGLTSVLSFTNSFLPS